MVLTSYALLALSFLAIAATALGDATLKKVTTAVYSFWVACIPVVHRASARSLRHETLLAKFLVRIPGRGLVRT